MQKDFDRWNEKKKKVHATPDVFGVHQREIWWVSFGINVGVEIDGKQDVFGRPALVLRKFNNQMVWVLPVTSQERNTPFYEQFSFNGTRYFVALTQLRTISTKRFLRKIGTLPKADFKRMQEKVSDFVIKDESPQSGLSRRPKP